MGTRNRVGIGLSYRAARIHRLAVPGLLKSLKIPSLQAGRSDNLIWRTGPSGYMGWRNQFLGIDSWAPQSLRIPSLAGGPVWQPYLTYRPARLQKLAESIPWNRVLGFLNIYRFGLWELFCLSTSCRSTDVSHMVTRIITCRYLYTDRTVRTNLKINIRWLISLRYTRDINRSTGPLFMCLTFTL
jgi:hypothetical protein